MGEKWNKAVKRPVEVKYRGPYTDPEEIETIEGDFEVDEEYIEETADGYQRAVQSSIMHRGPNGSFVSRETFEKHRNIGYGSGGYGQ